MMKRLFWLAPACLAVAWGQDAKDAFPHGVSGSIQATPNARGDVRLSIWADGAQVQDRALDLRGIVRNSTGCTLAASRFDTTDLSGACRLLHSDHGLVNDELRLAPLVAALHQAGVANIRITVNRESADEDLPPGWQQVSKARHVARFESNSAAELPPPLPIRMGHRVNPQDLIPPLIVVVFIPALLALWADTNGPGSAIWLNWISLASWFYWISAIDTGNIAAYFGGTLQVNLWAGLVFGAALYAMPPLISLTGCIIALAPQLLPGENSWDDLGQYIKRSLAGSAAWTVGLGIFLVGSNMFEYDWRIGTGSWLFAYLAYRLIAAWAARGNHTEMRALDSGDLIARINELAKRAGVQIKRVYLLRNRLPREANAFAFGAGRIGLTEGLLQGLTRREVDAVMAHEIGHLKGDHVGVQSSMVWIYYLIAGPLIGFAMTKAGMPEWIRMLPVAPILATFGMAYLSQRHEFTADARAAELTHDPEAKIAALARLAKLTRSPLDWGSVQGSIISHPSMRKRVLAIARRSGLAEDRALALLEDPDLLGGSAYDLARLESAVAETPGAAHYALPADLAQNDPLFNSAAKMRFLTANVARWEASVVVLLFAWAYLASYLFPIQRMNRWSFVTFLGGLFLIFWVAEFLSVLARRRFLNRLEQPIRGRLGTEGTFVGLMPGAAIRRSEAFAEWDLGLLTLGPEALVYRGERTQFSVPVNAIRGIMLAAEPFRWFRARRVVIRWSGGAFSLQRAAIGLSRGQARKLLGELKQWREGVITTQTASPAAGLPPPLLPAIPGDYVGKGRLAWIVVQKSGKLLIGSTILTAFLPMIGPLIGLVPFMTPVLVGLDALPAFFARRVKEERALQSEEIPSPVPAPSGAEK